MCTPLFRILYGTRTKVNFLIHSFSDIYIRGSATFLIAFFLSEGFAIDHKAVAYIIAQHAFVSFIDLGGEIVGAALIGMRL